MMEKKLERIDQEIELLKTRLKFGGPEVHVLCETLENVMRELKIFDQKRHKTEDFENDLNRRFEGIVLSLERITKILKENGLL